ncbi:MAG: DUF1573 domain-containing protein [Bacteroidota bacterium]
MPDANHDRFQESVGEVLVRHRSILDVLSKQQESSARVNRAIAKAVTSCGCLEISARRQEIPDDISFLKLKEFMNTHLNGALCEGCREVIEAELGQNLFYMAALCTLLGLRMEEILEKERGRITALGPYTLT